MGYCKIEFPGPLQNHNSKLTRYWYAPRGLFNPELLNGWLHGRWDLEVSAAMDRAASRKE
jgi:hypothetical protein